MTKFRNLEVTPDDGVDTWGVEGIGAAIERGQLADWRRIVATVRRDPNGHVAADLDEALDLTDGAGAAALLRTALDEARALGDSAPVVRQMRHDIRRTGLSLRVAARQLGTSASRLSTYLSGQVQPSAVFARRAEWFGRSNRI